MLLNMKQRDGRLSEENYLFFTIEEHTEMGENYYEAEPNGAARYGKFLKRKKK